MELKTNKTIWNEKLWSEVRELDSLKELRSKAWARFEATGFPTLKSESWRYTPVNSVMSMANCVRPAAPKSNAKLIAHLQAQLQPFKECARLIFINGWFMPQISDLKPLENVADFASVKELGLHRPTAIHLDSEETTGFSAMNAALFQDGVWLTVRENAQAPVPLLIYFFQDEDSPRATVQLHHWINMGKDSSLTVLKWHDSLSAQPVFTNHEFEIQLGQGSVLNQYRFQDGGAQDWLRSSVRVTMSEASKYQRVDFECGAKVSRNEISILMNGPEAKCDLSGIAAGAGQQHFDTQALMDHAVPAAQSSQSYRNLLGDSSRAVFGGRVKVRPNAQKTDAQQVHKTLLVSKEARAYVKPQLEIDADDVKCSHGAAIGQLSEDSLFYLQSRGISRSAAERMLASGFVEQILDSISYEPWKKLMQSRLQAKLDGVFQ